MSIEENRNCGCNDNMNDSMTSNMMNAEGRIIDLEIKLNKKIPIWIH